MLDPLEGEVYLPYAPSALGRFGRNLGDFADFDVFWAKFGHPSGFEEFEGAPKFRPNLGWRPNCAQNAPGRRGFQPGPLGPLGDQVQGGAQIAPKGEGGSPRAPLWDLTRHCTEF